MVRSSSRRGHGLAASFVVVVAAPACKKTSILDPSPNSSENSYVSRNYQGDCALSPVVHCPKNVSCNPPAPEPIDCPPDKFDAAGDSPGVTRRPPGKGDWLRVKPHLDVWGEKCQFTAERFCAPPKQPYTCTPYPEPLQVPCTRPGDAGTEYKTEPFVWKDVLGECHRIPSITCQGHCRVPEGETVACP